MEKGLEIFGSDWATLSDLHSVPGAEGTRGDFQHSRGKLWNIARNPEI